MGIQTEDYTKGSVPEDEIYKGWVTVDVPAIQMKKEDSGEFEDLIKQYNLVPNQFIRMQSKSNPFNYKIYRYLGGKRFRAVETPHLQWPIAPRNPEQLMALDLLFDPAVKMVTLIGPAGTGKTFLALLAGLHRSLND